MWVRSHFGAIIPYVPCTAEKSGFSCSIVWDKIRVCDMCHTLLIAIFQIGRLVEHYKAITLKEKFEKEKKAVRKSKYMHLVVSFASFLCFAANIHTVVIPYAIAVKVSHAVRRPEKIVRLLVRPSVSSFSVSVGTLKTPLRHFTFFISDKEIEIKDVAPAEATEEIEELSSGFYEDELCLTSGKA